MMLRALMCAVLLLAASLPAAPVLAENSGLEALTRRDKIFGWEAVGRINFDGGFCTGALIASDLVLTAAHCVYAPDGTPRPLEGMVFRAGLAGDFSIADVSVIRTVAHPDYRPGGKLDAGNIRHDVALMVLASAIPTATAAPFRVDRPRGNTEISVVSYAADRPDALSWQRRCTVVGKNAGLMGFDCDVTFGSSGAPVFDLSQGRAVIISIISAGGEDRGKRIAYGMELPGLIADLKAALRAGRSLQTAGAAQPAPVARTIRLQQAGARNASTGARFVKP